MSPSQTLQPHISQAAVSQVQVTTMASGHTVSSNTITSVLAGRAPTATVSVSAASSPPTTASQVLVFNLRLLQSENTFFLYL